MTTISSPLAIVGSDSPLINGTQLARLPGVRKIMSRSDFDAAVIADRFRIQNNGTGLYATGDEFQILGEAGNRTWFNMTGGTDAQNSAASHARTVYIGFGVSVVLAGDANVARTNSGAPGSGVGINGDISIDWGTNTLYLKSAGAWAANGTLITSLANVLTQLAALTGRVITLEAGGTPPVGNNIGDPFYVNLPAGTLATIYIQRNGVDIAGAVSVPNSNSYTYILTSEDLADGVSLTPRLASITYDTATPTRYSIELNDSEPDTIVTEWSKVMKSDPTLSQFNLAGPSATGKNLISVIANAGTVKFKYSGNFDSTSEINLTYTGSGSNKLRDYADNLAADFTNLVVANNLFVPPSPEAPMVANVLGRDDTLGFFNEMGGITCHGFDGDGTDGTDFSYMLVATTAASPNEISPDWLYGDGWIEMQLPDSSSVKRQIGFSINKDANQDYKNEFLLNYENGVLQAYVGHRNDPIPQNQGAYSTAVGNPFTVPSPSNLCWTRLRRSSDILTVDYSLNNKASWVTLYSYPDSIVDSLYGRLGVSGRNVPLLGVGLKGFSPEGTTVTTA